MADLPTNGVERPSIRGSATALWMLAAFTTALALVVMVHVYRAGHGQLSTALRVTARWSFIWFWMASAGGALATLFGSRFQAMARHARDFGLAFGSAHLVHLGLVALLYYAAYTTASPIPPGSLPSLGSLIFFSVAVFWTYLLAVLSIGHLSALFRQRSWRIARRIAIEYISLAFLVDFAKNPLEFGHGLIVYLPFQALAISGPLLRLAADAKRRRTASARPAQVARFGR